jgi:Protein of unknown function (Hypoth_ymh)
MSSFGCANATNVRDKFQREAAPEDLLLAAKSLRAHYERLNDILPEAVQGKSSLARHIGFREYRLERGDRESRTSDIEDICERDTNELEHAFQAWCKSPDHYDAELARAISDLLAHRQLDSAIRKTFAVLKERLCKRFRAPRDLDGAELVKKIFGTGCDLVTGLNDAERQAMRDLLAGLYGVFRNRFAHHDAQPSWAEADALISMVNHVLQDISHIK